MPASDESLNVLKSGAVVIQFFFTVVTAEKGSDELFQPAGARRSPENTRFGKKLKKLTTTVQVNN